MANHVYKQVEITGSSDKSIEEAVQVALAKAAESIHNLRWFEVTDIRGHIADQRLGHWQVTVKVGFTLDD